jgi:hypothetical protein
MVSMADALPPENPEQAAAAELGVDVAASKPAAAPQRGHDPLDDPPTHQPLNRRGSVVGQSGSAQTQGGGRPGFGGGFRR